MIKVIQMICKTALVVSAGTAFAQAADPQIDINGDGFYSFPELSTIYLEVTPEAFAALDTTEDGLLDMAEVAAAQRAGVWPAQD